MRTKLSKLLVRRNHNITKTTTINDDSSSSSSSTNITYIPKTKKKKKRMILAISRFVLPNNIRSIIRSVSTINKNYTSSNESKVDCLEEEEEVDSEENTNVSNPESIETKEISVIFPADKKPVTEALPDFLIKKLKRVTSGNLARVRSFRSNSFTKARSTCKEMDETEAKKMEVGEELCKKRILMGAKCRPLHVSGALHYDENGILLPEEILSPQH